MSGEIATVRIESDNRLTVRFPYREDAIAKLKQIPAEDRSWDPGRKVWIVEGEHLLTVLALLAQYFRRTEVYNDQGERVIVN